MKTTEPPSELAALREQIRFFVEERGWSAAETPKNLSIALSVEAAELLEHFQWLATGERSELREGELTSVSHEMADVLIYLVALADKLDVDLYSAASEKMALNRKKHPVASNDPSA